MPPQSKMLVAWTIACGDSTVEVYEDGSVESEDEVLHARISAHLGEPVDVLHTGGGGRSVVLQPSDRRYVVARVRKLVAEAPDLEMLGVRISGQ